MCINGAHLDRSSFKVLPHAFSVLALGAHSTFPSLRNHFLYCLYWIIDKGGETVGHSSIWKYRTSKQSQEMIVSFGLFAPFDWSPDQQLATLYSISNHLDSHYQPVTLRKKDGSSRQVYAPDRLLKQIQRNILTQLIDETRLTPYATAYRKGASLVSNALPHVGQSQVLKLDIENFFDSIQFRQVMASAFPSHHYPPDVQYLLTNLCCYRESLPQGAPTSAAISNLVLTSFDTHIGEWCADRGLNYTRYCDDMTFSGEFQPRRVMNKVRSFLETYQFDLNEKKTKVLSTHDRQLVTGVVVNEKLQVSRTYRRQLKQEIYYCQKFGVASHLIQQKKLELDAVNETVITRYLQSLMGKVIFVLQINPEDQLFQKLKPDVLALMASIQL